MLQLRNLFFLIIFQILIGFTALYAQGITDGPVTLEAESLQYEENTGLIHATGNILLSFLGYSVNAQEFQFSPDNQMLFLKDKIAIQKKDQLLSSDSIKYNLDKNQAVATN
ncbi:hypothetical protein HN928_03225, partial [bacterium]|nr:hypothetical protein [bacterium]